MGNLGFQELLVIAFLALLVVGPERLPQLARQAGQLLARIRQETSRSVTELKRAAEIEDLDRELKTMRAELRQVGREVATAAGEPTSTRAPHRYQPPPPTDPDAT